jgi:hypothetical protein
MLDEGFNVFYNKRPFEKLLLEDSTGIIKHLTHLEEYILTKKAEGLNIAVNFLDELYKSFKGHGTSAGYTTVKYDGAPAIIAGYNPENNRFFVSTKSVANVNPKINYTVQDVDINHGNIPDLAKKLKFALQYLPYVLKSGLYQGDFMFDKDSRQFTEVEGVKYVTFKPNTIVYAVPVDTELGKKVINAKIGIIFHTKYTGPNLASLTKSSDVNFSEFTVTPDVWVDDAKFKDLTGIATFTAEEDNAIQDLRSQVLKSSKAINWDMIPEDFYPLANTYVNTLIREGKFVEDPTSTYDTFIEWYKARTEKGIEKLKTLSGRTKATDNLNTSLSLFGKSKLYIVSVFNLTKMLEQMKMIFIRKYNQAITTKQFLTQPDGSLKVTNPEGYVAVDRVGNMIKLVDRLEFSRANFALSKGEKFK